MRLEGSSDLFSYSTMLAKLQQPLRPWASSFNATISTATDLQYCRHGKAERTTENGVLWHDSCMLAFRHDGTKECVRCGRKVESGVFFYQFVFTL